ncbi:hypothetical protein L596_006524 [Steinernema carpocapsae]|uniref:5'-3' exoribonuclease 1 n=1 Tax=Steinernema carpocapsae TaxID=34508 RepID=A0A4U8V2K8_STECR|nr:hypothetical protein L596_006524 [Steinernema carpocapsae]
MGVPKFFRFISERYAALMERVQENQIPEFDNLYLDMNGIIHNCSHPNDDDVSFRISEEEIFGNIFQYLDQLFSIIGPKKVFFMAVDGVAPRAKMNQQRARRFMSARNAEHQQKQALAAGKPLPTSDRFDSNCITPGTSFMIELQKQLEFFIQMKQSTDAKWRDVRVYLSGHNVPGEGEHKIMDFIRTERSKPDYDPNTRHCCYGLDADLIILGLCSHEPHFALLREEVTFNRAGQKKDKVGIEGTKFFLLHLSLMREYLAMEFQDLKETTTYRKSNTDSLPFALNEENVIDDWVLMTFLIGNDFLPHLPNVHIHEDALPRLYKAYKAVLPSLGGYINERGILNLKRLETFFERFSVIDRDNYLDQFEDADWMRNKKQREQGEGPPDVIPQVVFEGLLEEEDVIESSSTCVSSSDIGAFDTDSEDERKEVEKITGVKKKKNGGDVIPSASEALAAGGWDSESSLEIDGLNLEDSDESPDENWNIVIHRSFKKKRRDYYAEKLNYVNISAEELDDQARGYVRALQWNLHYYYHGCMSWSWYYPHHYAPYLTDVRNFGDMKIEFDLGEPFNPYEQLLAVLPAASCRCVPPALRPLMTESSSPISAFYPTDFKTDLNGKRNDWEAVVLVPFIDENLLLRTAKAAYPSLTEAERRANTHTGDLLYTYSTKDLGELNSSCAKFDRVAENHSKCENMEKNAFRLPRSKIVTGLLPQTKLDVYFPGFPTTKHLNYTGSLEIAPVKVFHMPTRKPVMILKIGDNTENKYSASGVDPRSLLGQEVQVNWPLLKLAKVCSVVTPDGRYLMENHQTSFTDFGPNKHKVFKDIKDMVTDREFGRYGICVSNVKAIVEVNLFTGSRMKFKGNNVIVEKSWSDDVFAVSDGLVLQNVEVKNDMEQKFKSAADAFPVGSKVFLNSFKVSAYGMMGTVARNDVAARGTCLVEGVAPLQVNVKAAVSKKQYKKFWFSVFDLAKIIGQDKHVVNRVTGTVIVQMDSDFKDEEQEERGKHHHKHGHERPRNNINVGINLKYTKRNEAIVDFSKRENETWYYSLFTLKVVQDYAQRFPEVFRALRQNKDQYLLEDFWPELSPEERTNKAKEVVEFLKALPCSSRRPETCNYKYADPEELLLIQKEIAATVAETNVQQFTVHARALFRPDFVTGDSPPVPNVEFKILDRVIVAKTHRYVSPGAAGTVIGIKSQIGKETELDVMFDVPIVGGSNERTGPNGLKYTRVFSHQLLNITHAARLRGGDQSESPSDNQPQSSRQRFGNNRTDQRPQQHHKPGHYKGADSRMDNPKPSHHRAGNSRPENQRSGPPKIQVLQRPKQGDRQHASDPPGSVGQRLFQNSQNNRRGQNNRHQQNRQCQPKPERNEKAKSVEDQANKGVED